MLVFLTQHPSARERKYKNLVNATILKEMFTELKDVDRKKLAEALKVSQSVDRAWRKVTEENPHLRGKDYDEKGVLEYDTQRTLGYY